MKIAIIGQQDFGKAVLEAFLARNDEVAAVFCAPEKPGAQPDPLARRPRNAAPGPSVRLAARPEATPAHEGARRRSRHHGLRAAVRARQLREASRGTAPSSTIRRCCRGIAARRRSTGRSSRARPDRAHDLPADRRARRGPVVLQKETAIGPDDTLGDVYFDRLFPMGVAGDAGGRRPGGRRHPPRDRAGRSQASYEGWCRDGRGADPLGPATSTTSTT